MDTPAHQVSTPIGVTGATGNLGGGVARLLAEAGVTTRLLVRDAARAPDLPGAQTMVCAYDDGQSLLRAFDGVRTLLMVSAEEAPDRLEQHRTVVRAATAAGVERVVYTSFLGAAPDAIFHLARDHFHTEQALTRSGMAFVALRNSLYADMLPDLAVDGVIAGPAGDGRVAPVARADIIEVATAALRDEAWDGAFTFDVTGPRTVTMDEAATWLTDHTGHPVRYEDQTLDQARSSRAVHGAPAWMVEAWISTYSAIAAGEMDVVADTVERITGHPATPLSDYARQPQLVPPISIADLQAR